MEPDTHAPSDKASSSHDSLQQVPPPPLERNANKGAFAHRLFIGPMGLRAGWSALLFILFSALFVVAGGMILVPLLGIGHSGKAVSLAPTTALLSEVIQVLAVLGAGAIMAAIEHRHLKDYFFRDRHCPAHFFAGLAAGFIALSVLVGAMVLGGWLHFGPVALSGARIAGYGALWALVFLLTGFFEEGSFRCYLQFTFTRGMNFWWALGIVGAVCLVAGSRGGEAARGVFIIAGLGLIPCLWVHVKRVPDSNFWQAAWVTSTLFGFIHTSNTGENWIGIFAAAGIGFVFCLSIWVTGSVWWAIGCHAAWDWAETFFYGTADSGLVPKGHFLTTTPAGSVFWSGGTDGPEGSVLILGILVLFIVALLLIYGRKRAVALPEPSQPLPRG
ncbi:MAG TPA: CPBP family intramembrane glutamic endopeptidase [Terracidiphilus sp.]